MSRSEALAVEFERVNRELIEHLKGLDRDQWLTRCVNSPVFKIDSQEDENRPVGTIAHHVASAHQRIIDFLPLAMAGQPLPRPQSGSSAAHAAENPEPDQSETIDLLESRGARIATLIRAMTEEQLAREVTTFIGTGPLERFVATVVTVHPYWHLTSIRATLEPAARAT